jgi:glycosyltransferase involved in cell wall biosynthesis
MSGKLSIVIPVFNEQDTLPGLLKELGEVLNGMKCQYEILIIDDGSGDKTWQVIADAQKANPRIKGIKLSRNFGQTAALSAGFAKASGDIIVTIDGDGQNNPADIPKLIEKLDEGYDLVSGWRKDRKDPYFNRVLPSRIANIMIRFLTGVKVNDFGCTLKAYRAELVKHIKLYGEMHRMIPALAYWAGAKIGDLEVDHRPRKYGRSNYSWGRVCAVFFDLITMKFFAGYFTRPLYVFGLAGLAMLMLGFVAFAALVVMKVYHNIDITGNPFLMLGALAQIIGVQLIALGLLGEINIRVYYETQNKTTYIVKEEIGFK